MDRLQRFNPDIEAECRLCGTVNENPMHLFLQCCFSEKIWDSLESGFGGQCNRAGSVQSWARKWLEGIDTCNLMENMGREVIGLSERKRAIGGNYFKKIRDNMELGSTIRSTKREIDYRLDVQLMRNLGM